LPKGATPTRYILEANVGTKQAWYKLAMALNELMTMSAGWKVVLEADATQGLGSTS